MKSRFVIFLTGLVMALALFACQEPQEPENKEGIPVGITGINHTTTYIADFYVEEAWGGSISSIQNGGGGGGTTCCISLPYHYRTGLEAKVRWNHTESRIDNWKEAVASIEPYSDGGGRAWVHFMQDGSVRIVVSNYAPGHSDYPGPAIEVFQEESTETDKANKQ